jgi:hypothetical protein
MGQIQDREHRRGFHVTRFETTVVALAAFAVAAVHTPAFGQYVVFDGKDSSVTVKSEVKAGRPSKNKKSAPAEPPAPPEPKKPTFTATGTFESTKEKARDSAVRAAVAELEDQLSKQSPPVRHRSPSRMSKLVQQMLLPDQEKVTEEPIISDSGKSETMYRVTVAVCVEDKHVRELRSHDRASNALWVLAGIGGLAGMIALFFRVDSWTKGYLTSWLVLGTVGAAALLAGLWWMAK